MSRLNDVFLTVDPGFVFALTPTVVRHEWVFKILEWEVEIGKRKYNALFLPLNLNSNNGTYFSGLKSVSGRQPF